MRQILSNPLVPLSPWFILLVATLLSDERYQYVADWHVWLLIGGLVIVVFGAIGWWRRGAHPEPAAPRSWSALLVHALPLYLFVAVDSESLELSKPIDPSSSGHALARIRATAPDPGPPPAPLTAETRAQLHADLFDPAAELHVRPLDADQAERLGYADQLSAQAAARGSRASDLIKINQLHERRRGGQVSVIARIAPVDPTHLEAITARLPTPQHVPSAAIYRFVMTCCAADSMPVKALLCGEVPELPPEHSWIELRGTLLPGPDDLPAMLSVEYLAPVDEPKRPYLTLPLLGP